MSGPDALNRDCPDLPLLRWGVLSGKSPRASRRWRLFFVQFQPFSIGEGVGYALRRLPDNERGR